MENEEMILSAAEELRVSARALDQAQDEENQAFEAWRAAQKKTVSAFEQARLAEGKLRTIACGIRLCYEIQGVVVAG